MRTELRYVLPDVVEASKLSDLLGKNYECPYCKSQNLTMEGASDTGWIKLDFRRSRDNWICMGCCIDIFGTVTDEEFHQNPYRSLVEEIARNDQMSVDEYRMLALRMQKHEIEQRPDWNQDARLVELSNHIDSLLAHLETAG